MRAGGPILQLINSSAHLPLAYHRLDDSLPISQRRSVALNLVSCPGIGRHIQSNGLRAIVGEGTASPWRSPAVSSSSPTPWWSRWSFTWPPMPAKSSPRKSTSFIRSTSLLRYPLPQHTHTHSLEQPHLYIHPSWIWSRLSVGFRIVENGIRWGSLYRWSEEGGGQQRLGACKFLFLISFCSMF